MAIEWGETSRGFAIGNFMDDYEQTCSIQSSSSVESRIWLGVEDALWNEIYDRQKPYERDGGTYRHLNARMHLSREMAAELAVLLMAFAETGDLPVPSERASR